MLIIPAIDIKNGKCVRLIQGDPKRETVYSDNPVSMAKSFEKIGAKLIHVVDLDGAFSGFPVNRDIVIEIAKSVSIQIEIGGGIRSLEAVEEYVSAGIKRVILGTVVIGKHFEEYTKRFQDNIIVGIDAKDSMIATHGWKNVSSKSAVEYIKELRATGIKEIIYTDIATDGMLTGPNYQSIENILKESEGISLIASGGVSSIEDIERLNEYTLMGLKGCIVGKAIYDKRIDFREAVNRFH